MPMFSTKNSANNGDYYTGMTPGQGIYKGVSAVDDLTKDFGDPTEGLLAQALSYISTGKYITRSVQTQSLATSSKNVLSADQKRTMEQRFTRSKVKGLMLKTPSVFKKKK